MLQDYRAHETRSRRRARLAQDAEHHAAQRAQESADERDVIIYYFLNIIITITILINVIYFLYLITILINIQLIHFY